MLPSIGLGWLYFLVMSNIGFLTNIWYPDIVQLRISDTYINQYQYM